MMKTMKETEMTSNRGKNGREIMFMSRSMNRIYGISKFRINNASIIKSIKAILA